MKRLGFTALAAALLVGGMAAAQAAQIPSSSRRLALAGDEDEADLLRARRRRCGFARLQPPEVEADIGPAGVVGRHMDDAAGAFARLRDVVPAAVVTDGANGAHVRYGGVEAHVPAYPCDPKDLTGAGDMFAGAFLYGITHDIHPARAAQAANFLAMKVITQFGARLHHGTRQFWDDVLSGG